MKKISTLLFVLAFFFLVGLESCRNTKVACPGAGQNKASDMALFDEDGKPLSKKKRKKASKKNENGLINKNQPSNLKRRTKKSLNDRPNK